MTEDQPLITIGLLTYNNEGTLKRALDSLTSQDYERKEILIFDDVSTDETYTICQKYAQKYPFIRLFRNEKNLGVFKNLERMLSHITGDYFLWACPDDFYFPSFTKKCIQLLERYPDLASANSSVEIVYVDEKGITQDHRKEIFSSLRLSKYPTDKQRFNVAKSILNPPPSYLLYTHAVLRTRHLDLLRQNPTFYSIEELLPLFLFYRGGMGSVEEVLQIKYQSAVPLEQRHPAIGYLYTSVNSRMKCYVHAISLAFKYEWGVSRSFELACAIWTHFFCWVLGRLKGILSPWIGPLYRKIKKNDSKTL